MPHSSAARDHEDDGLYVENYYALLNVSPNATTEEINRAFRQKSRMFHPDRHLDPQTKVDAEQFFVRLRKAHDTLTNARSRSIYDALGVKGLEVAGWELLPQSYTANDIKREFLFLCQLKEDERLMECVHPTGTLSVKCDATELFRQKDENDPDEARYLPELTGMSLSQSVDCPISKQDRLCLSGNLASFNGRGSAAVALNWRRPLGTKLMTEIEMSMGDHVAISSKLSALVSQHTSCTIQPRAAVYIDAQSLKDLFFSPSIDFSATTQMSYRLHGTLSLTLGRMPAITTTLIYMDLGRPKFLVAIKVGPQLMACSGKAVYTHRLIENEAFYRCSIMGGLFGVISSVHYERKWSRFSRVGCSLKLALPSGSLVSKFRLRRGAHSWEVETVLCDSQLDLPRSAFCGLLIPLTVAFLTKAIFRRWIDDCFAFFDEPLRNRQVDQTSKEQAVKAREIMRNTAERIRLDEEKKMGLLLVDAKYGEIVESSRENIIYENERTIDVTIPLQALVVDSKLILYESTKCQLPGFYDPCPGEKKLLRVRYKFRDSLHQTVVTDEQPLCIPKQSHRI